MPSIARGIHLWQRRHEQLEGQAGKLTTLGCETLVEREASRWMEARMEPDRPCSMILADTREPRQRAAKEWQHAVGLQCNEWEAKKWERRRIACLLACLS
jgi:hypothetical protein